MMKTLRKTYIFLFLATLMACTEYGEFERRLTTADSLMNHGQADSAFRMLCGMNAEAESMPDALQMRHLLLRSNAQNKVDSLFTSDSIGNVLVEYYDQYGTPNERMLAHYMKGCAYRDMGDQPATLRCFNDAVAAADTSMTDCNYDQLSIIYGQIARIFRKRAMSDNALQAYEYAERYARKIQDSIGIFTIWGNKSNVLLNQGKIKEGLHIKEAAAEGFRNIGHRQNAARIRGLCIKWYARQGEFEKAKAAMDDYEEHSGYFMDNGDIEPGREDYYHIKGTYYLEKGQLDSAEHFFRKLKNSSETVNSQYLAAWGLSQLFRKQNISDSVAKYAYLGDVLGDTLYSEQTAENLQNAQAMYNYARHQENALRKELETKDMEISRRNWIIAGVLLLSIIVFFWRRQIRLKKSELRTANRKNTQLSTQLHTANEENAQLNTQIDANNQEISSLNTRLDTAHRENTHLNTQIDANNLKIAQLNEQISEKGQLIKQLNEVINKNAADLQLNAQLQQTVAILEERLAAYLKEKEIHSRTHNLNTLQQQPVVKHFTELANGRTAYPTYKDWHTLYPLVEEFYPQLAVLRKDISDAEYQICVLTKLGFRLSDIGHLMNVSKAYMSTTRKRLSEKLFHTDEGSAKLFDQRIKEL
ncbi:MAG: hypothetical protein IIU51_05215 [Bacteroidaceae bacterium]|nr:hypothetical protein [Bacteroidaceae bacterium]